MNFNNLQKVYDCVGKIGVSRAAKKLGYAESSVRRYVREYNAVTGGRRKVKILVVDIETTPINVLVWSLNGRDYIPHDRIKRDWNILCWSAKWLCAPDVMSDVLRPREARAGNDKRILKSIGKLLDESDIVIAHNGLGFDIPKINTRLYYNGLLPPSPYRVIDTLRHARKTMGFTSNKLDYLGNYTMRKKKIKTEFSLWDDCMNGDQSALDYMVKYNKTDVLLLEDVYIDLLPWIKPHPNIGIYIDSDSSVCPSCGSKRIEITDKFYITSANKYRSVRCKDCGSWARMATGDLTLQERRSLLRSAAI